jgi:hypothetical protein
MSMGIVFAILVVLGFAFQFAGTWPVPNFPSSRLGWGCWLVASLLWAITSSGGTK